FEFLFRLQLCDIMKYSPLFPFVRLFLFAFSALSTQVLYAQSNGVLREVYTGIAGTAVSDLTNSPSFPNSPTTTEVLTTFEAPTDVDDSYGQRLSAYVIAPQTGTYLFWIASDDN